MLTDYIHTGNDINKHATSNKAKQLEIDTAQIIRQPKHKMVPATNEP